MKSGIDIYNSLCKYFRLQNCKAIPKGMCKGLTDTDGMEALPRVATGNPIAWLASLCSNKSLKLDPTDKPKCKGRCQIFRFLSTEYAAKV